MASNRIDMQLTSNATSFARGMAQASRGIRGLGNASTRVSAQLREMDRSMLRTSRSARSLQNAFRGYLTLQTVRGVGRFTQNLVQMSSALVEQAAAVGTTSDRLEVFQRVLRGEGATTQQINQGLVQLTRNIGLAANETGPAQEVFQQFGIAIRNADGSIRGSLEVYEDLVDALAGIAPQARAAALGLAIGEEAARTFAASASQGGDALRSAFRREAGFGVATDAQNQQLKSLGDTMRTLVDSVQTLGRVLLARFAGSLEEIARRARELVSRMIRIEQTTMGITNAIVEVVGRIREFAERFGTLIQVFAAARIFNVVSSTFGGLASSLGIAARAAAGLAGGLVNVINLGGRVSSFFGRFSGGAVGRFIDSVGGGPGAGVLGALGRITGIGGTFLALGNLRDAIQELFEPLRSLDFEMENFDETAALLNESMETLEGSFTQLNQVRPDVAERFRAEFERLQRQFEFINRAVGPTADVFGPVFSEEQVEAARRRLRAAAQSLNQSLYDALFTPPPDADEQAAELIVGPIRRGLANGLGQIEGTISTFAGRSNTIFSRWSEGFGTVENRVGRVVTGVRQIPNSFIRIEPEAARVTEAITRRMDGAAVSIGEVADRVDEMSPSLNRAAEFGAAAGSSIASSFADAVLEIDNAGDALKALGRTLIQLAAQVFIGGPLSNFLSGLFTRAHIGAAVRGGQLVQPLSGEAFVAPTAGRVLSRSEVDRLGGGERVTVNVVVESGVDTARIDADVQNAVRAAMSEVQAGRRVR